MSATASTEISHLRDLYLVEVKKNKDLQAESDRHRNALVEITEYLNRQWHERSHDPSREETTVMHIATGVVPYPNSPPAS